MTEVVRPVAARIFEVTGTLGADASNASRAWRERRGLLLEICDREGRIGQGEASPLPGFSSDTLAEARADLLGVDWAGLPDLDPCGGLLHEGLIGTHKCGCVVGDLSCGLLDHFHEAHVRRFAVHEEANELIKLFLDVL